MLMYKYARRNWVSKHTRPWPRCESKPTDLGSATVMVLGAQRGREAFRKQYMCSVKATVENYEHHVNVRFKTSEYFQFCHLFLRRGHTWKKFFKRYEGMNPEFFSEN